MPPKVILICLENPGGNLHGGAVRQRGLESALAANDYEVELLPIPQAPTGEAAGAVWKILGRLKRQLLPLPIVRRPGPGIAEILGTSGGPIILSTVPGVTYALAARGQGVHWADYYDLPARFAVAEATSRSGLAKLTTRGQSRLLAAHHRRAVRSALVSTYAGFGDYVAAGSRPNSHWLPPVVAAPAVGLPPNGRPRVAGFLANFNYWPNVDALDNLVDNWLEALSRAGFAVVVGGFGADKIRGLSPEVRNLGQVASIDEFYSVVDVVLVPVRRGSGIKVKAMEGLLSGRPVVVDPHVLDGFPEGIADCFAVYGEHGLGHEELSVRSRGAASVTQEAVKIFSPDHQRRIVGQVLDDLSEHLR